MSSVGPVNLASDYPATKLEGQTNSLHEMDKRTWSKTAKEKMVKQSKRIEIKRYREIEM